MLEIKVPEFGESIQEVQVGEWLKKVGDFVDKDEEMVELESDKATQALSAPEAGVLQKIEVETGGFAQVGDLLCVMAPGGKGSVAAEPQQQTAAAGSAPAAQPPAASATATADVPAASWIMPAAERVLNEYKISADAIRPTGPGGRLQKEDVLGYIEKHGLKPGGGGVASAPAPVAAPANSGVDAFTAPAPVAAAPAAPTPQRSVPSGASQPQTAAQTAAQTSEWNEAMGGGREEKVVPMSMIRRTIAKRLVEAQQTAALLTTFNEIDMKPVMDLRAKYKDPFLKKHGVKLGFMSFFAKAAVESLKRFPAVNSEVQGNNVIWKEYFDIGIAIGGGKGLVVPVLRNVEGMSFADVEQNIGKFAGLAKENKIKPADLKGGTFTISNGGVYGSLLSTPIVNPPQSGILGLHSIQQRPIALDGEVVIRPMMYVALTYDHRIVDGREAVGFLKTIKEVLEEPARLFLEV
jgi:2-oxoglutarate dehydrogenase E2 component (dihydrolipoamide succinyltransferase)